MKAPIPAWRALMKSSRHGGATGRLPEPKFGMVRLSELWYRHYEDAMCWHCRMEKRSNTARTIRIIRRRCARSGTGSESALPRMRVSIWLGPHKLMDVPSPLPHRIFHMFLSGAFARTQPAPYGLIRDMRGPQDQIIDLDILLYEVLNSVKVGGG